MFDPSEIIPGDFFRPQQNTWQLETGDWWDITKKTVEADTNNTHTNTRVMAVDKQIDRGGQRFIIMGF